MQAYPYKACWEGEGAKKNLYTTEFDVDLAYMRLLWSLFFGRGTVISEFTAEATDGIYEW